MDYTDSWNNKSVFLKQLELNKRELDNNYPSHWFSFIKLMSQISGNMSMLDIGCGVGSYYELCRRHLPNISYMGIDYSPHAIEIAKEEWSCDRFLVMNVKNLDTKFVSEYDIIHMGALLDVLPNGDDILDFILKLKTRYVLISRIEVSQESEVSTYTAYDEITTYKYKHGKDLLLKIIYRNGYDIFSSDGNNLLLKNKEYNGN